MTRTFVAELNPVVSNDGSTTRILVGTDPWATGPSDTPASTPVRPFLKHPGTLRRSMFADGGVTGGVSPSYGAIVIANTTPQADAAGTLDAWADYGFAGTELVVRMGELGAAYPDAFTIVYRAQCHTWLADVGQIVIRQRDQTQLFLQPILTDGFLGTGGIEGNGAVAKRKQWVSQDPGFFEPILVDANKQIYFVQATSTGGLHDSYLSDPSPEARPFDVWDAGVRLDRGPNYDSQAQLLSQEPAEGEVRYWFGPASVAVPSWYDGPVYFRLGSVPSGDLRVYGYGAPNDRDHAAMGRAVGSFTASTLALRAGVSSDRVAAGGLTIIPTLVDDESTYLDVLNDTAAAALGWFGFDRLGVFRSGYLRDPASTSVYYGITPGLLAGTAPTADSVSVHTFDNPSGLRRAPPGGVQVPKWSVSGTAGAAWPCQVAGGASATMRDYLSRRVWSSFSGVDANAVLRDPGAEHATVHIRGRHLQAPTAMRLWLERFLVLYAGRRHFYSFETPLTAELLDLDLDSVVTLQSPRFGMASGVKGRVVGVDIDCSGLGTITWTVWTGTPGQYTSGSSSTRPSGGGGGGGSTPPAVQVLQAMGDFGQIMVGTVSVSGEAPPDGGTDGGGTQAGLLGDFGQVMLGFVGDDESAGTVAWNTANEVGTWTFTAADQTAEYISGAGTNSVVSGTARSSGKRYFEVSWDVAGSFSSLVRDDVGLTTSNPPTSGASVTDGAAYRRSGHVFHANANIATETAIASTDVLGVAADLDTGDVWFAINGTWVQGDPATATSPSVTGLAAGTYYAGATIESGATMTVTLRTLNADFTQPKPAGFKSWAAA